MPGFGVLYRWQLPFLLLGVYSIFKNRSVLTTLIILAAVISIVPAALARPSPHTLRSLMLSIPIIITIGIGILSFFSLLKPKKIILSLLLALIIIGESLYFGHFYTIHYPKINSLDWGAGFRQTVIEAKNYSKDYKLVVVDKNITFFPIYAAYYAPDLKYEMVDVSWKKPVEFEDSSVLLIRPNYGEIDNSAIQKIIYLPKTTDIHTILWKI